MEFNHQTFQPFDGATLVMPHEDLTRPQEKIPFLDRITFYKQLVIHLAKMRFSNYERKIDICQQLFNGRGVGRLHKKFDFVELIRELDYVGPEQALFEPGVEKDFHAALHLFNIHRTVLCKPKDGQQGEGIFLCESEQELQDKLKQVKETYIVQQFIPPIKDFRYVYHRDTDVTYRFCYSKNRPMVYGDGKSNLRSIIESEPNIPATSKERLIKYLKKSQLNRVPEMGEEIPLIDSGNISKGAYGIVVKGEELKAIDKIMLQLIQDIKDKYGLSLTTYCFDIGALKENINTETVSKQDFVFYEYQIPFGLTGYLNAEEVKEEKSNVAKLFMNSLQRSWIARHKNPLSA